MSRMISDVYILFLYFFFAAKYIKLEFTHELSGHHANKYNQAFEINSTFFKLLNIL